MLSFISNLQKHFVLQIVCTCDIMGNFLNICNVRCNCILCFQIISTNYLIHHIVLQFFLCCLPQLYFKSWINTIKFYNVTKYESEMIKRLFCLYLIYKKRPTKILCCLVLKCNKIYNECIGHRTFLKLLQISCDLLNLFSKTE